MSRRSVIIKNIITKTWLMFSIEKSGWLENFMDPSTSITMMRETRNVGNKRYLKFLFIPSTLPNVPSTFQRYIHVFCNRCKLLGMNYGKLKEFNTPQYTDTYCFPVLYNSRRVLWSLEWTPPLQKIVIISFLHFYDKESSSQIQSTARNEGLEK